MHIEEIAGWDTLKEDDYDNEFWKYFYSVYKTFKRFSLFSWISDPLIHKTRFESLVNHFKVRINIKPDLVN